MKNIDTAVDSFISPGIGRLRWSLRGNPEAELQISAYPSAGDECRIEWRHGDKSGAFRAPLDGDADIENAANALAFMIHQGIDADVIAARFPQLHKIGRTPERDRGVNGCSLIHDSYTSDFSSLRPALDFMRRRKDPGADRHTNTQRPAP